MKMAECLYGKKLVDSNYTFTKFILDSTTEKMSIFSSILEDVRNTYRLQLKLLRAHSDDQLTIYNFDNGAIKGFQEGSPKNN